MTGRRPSALPQVVACDFDGTITQEDVTNLIWDKHLAYDWRSVLLPPSVSGAIAPLEMIARGYAGVRRSPDELLSELRPQVRLRAGFAEFVALCAGAQWSFEVLSYGLRFYLTAFLSEVTAIADAGDVTDNDSENDRSPGALPPLIITAFEGTFADGRWTVAPPRGASPAEGSEFKADRVKAMQARHPDCQSVYIGDGRLDFPAARLCDHIFAVQGSTLARLCREHDIACREFTDFRDIGRALMTSS